MEWNGMNFKREHNQQREKKKTLISYFFLLLLIINNLLVKISLIGKKIYKIVTIMII